MNYNLHNSQIIAIGGGFLHRACTLNALTKVMGLVPKPFLTNPVSFGNRHCPLFPHLLALSRA